MYSAISFIRELSPLLVDSSNPSDNDIWKFIRRAESVKINAWLGERYKVPLVPTSYLTGTITVNADSKIVTGSSTTFTSDLNVFDVVQIASSGEVVRVASIESNTQFTATSEIVTSASASSFWIMPDEIVTASEFITAYMLIDFYFAEQASNQDEVEKYIDRMLKFAGDIIDQLKNGDYINDDLTSATDAERVGEISYSDTSDFRELIEDNDELFIDSTFIK